MSTFEISFGWIRCLFNGVNPNKIDEQQNIKETCTNGNVASSDEEEQRA